MNRTQERIKNRRQYLKNKGAAYTKASLYTLMALACAVFAFSLLMAARAVMTPPFVGAATPVAFLIVGSMALVIGMLSWALARSAYETHQQARWLPYVPPVTASALPAEEILLRGSVEPEESQSKVLLRGTDSSTGTGEQELLRGSTQQEK